ncbi:D-ribose ABC transporter substrate-binding protein [Siminovitchia terrae]|uniref:D-ribose ABC transporter substrate-binding protein n=1 Tax=Siminovitchia terrae TaxID=1914933 RepID=A0ABQ4L242_SIMTE|nr:sugar ABC transporter substrate-binding protein [Siminovitchia terrae]GIN91716.1 D-ribose ABC transporter substrate-binding protein [Siminovitchia terrae]GIN98356.1 D-ribose ABC transporter substrate-binding protein [Siminovitchia terrae]
MKRKKSFIFLAIIISAFITLTGCGNTNSQAGSADETKKDGKSTIAVVLKGSDQEYFKLAEAGAKQAFEDFNVNGKFLAASSQTQEQELINILEDLLTSDPDGLVVMPSTESAVPTLDKYTQKDIPVLLIDTDLDWVDKLSYIGTDNYTAGQKAAEYLVSQMSKGDEAAILEGVSGAAVSEERVKGAKDYLEKNGIKVVSSQAADFDRTKAVNTMENILTANPNIKGIFTANDEMALGALKAIQSAGLDIPIIGIDGTTDGLKSISDGDIAATIAQKPYDMAYNGVENALKAINGDSVDSKMDSPIELITLDNAKENLEEINKILGKN